MPSALDITNERERALLAPYAQRSADSAGRRHPEPPHPYRGPYQRDRDRILHCAAFRRLSYKTQVFTGEMGDYHRTRLTHTLEVASIARTIARALRLNEDLVEALALAHDIGHPPFGHSGEDVLNECLREHGGFTHNAQALRIFEVLETRYPDFPGLNLTAEVLEGQRARAEKRGAGSTEHGAGSQEREAGKTALSGSVLPAPRSQLQAPCSPLLEVQVLDAADSIAYDAHDADDSLELGLLRLEELLEVPMWREAAERVGRRFTNLNDRHLRRAIVHAVIDWQVSDIVAATEREIAERGIRSVADVRSASTIVKPSPQLAERKMGLERFLFSRVYRHPDVLAKRRHAQQALRETFELLVEKPDCLPVKFRRLAERDGVHRAVGDYLAGMTDRYAVEEHLRLVRL
ncbi:MAG TPA: deoxyguanosinetriphosphate triphosphohydrolase [Lacipirellulaceae bacterium]|nr:deoxyguanosinetriphosphate triphosphohydrolase [Lacipirellulaceae bacterium]